LNLCVSRSECYRWLSFAVHKLQSPLNNYTCSSRSRALLYDSMRCHFEYRHLEDAALLANENTEPMLRISLCNHCNCPLTALSTCLSLGPHIRQHVLKAHSGPVMALALINAGMLNTSQLPGRCGTVHVVSAHCRVLLLSRSLAAATYLLHEPVTCTCPLPSCMPGHTADDSTGCNCLSDCCSHGTMLLPAAMLHYQLMNPMTAHPPCRKKLPGGSTAPLSAQPWSGHSTTCHATHRKPVRAA
jgi:hypothetical protein